MKKVLVVAAGLVLAFGPAAAQDVWGWSIIIPSVTGTDQLGTYLRGQMNQQEEARSPTSAAPGASPASLVFKPSAERRAANFERLLERGRGADPAAIQQLRAALSDPTLFPRLQRELDRYDLRADNMADAYAIWWISAWQAARLDSSDPRPQAVRAVKAQAENAFLANPVLLNAGDAQKQELAETLLVQAMIMSAGVEQVKKDPSQAGALGHMVRRMARGFGLDLDAMTLTDAGFVSAG